jgi:hypothetical protein
MGRRSLSFWYGEQWLRQAKEEEGCWFIGLLGNSGKYITLETSKSNGILKVCFSGAGNSRTQEL